MIKRLMLQGQDFSFTAHNMLLANKIVDHYPVGRQASALIPLLDLAQRQSGGWLPQEAVEYVCAYLNVPAMQGVEVATFYSMFNLKPVGKYFLQVCTTTPCQLRGSQKILEQCLKFTNVPMGSVSKDGLFSVSEVECLGACANAPIVQINDEYYEDLTPDLMQQILTNLQEGFPITPGSQIGRQGAAPSISTNKMISNTVSSEEPE